MRRLFAFVIPAVLTIACGSARSPISPSAPDGTPAHRIVVLGDSLAVSPSPAESFPARLQVRIDSDALRWQVVNASVSGATTDDGRARVEGLLTRDVGILMLELGANDGLRGLPTNTIEDNLTSIITSAQTRAIRVLLCGMETPPTHGFDYSLAFHFVFPTTAQRLSVPLVPFILAGVALNPELNGADLVHPNAAGAERIAETIWPYLRAML
jgi:acyl-CoA thioesterase-1